MVSRHHHVDRLVQVGDVAHDLDAAVALHLQVDVWAPCLVVGLHLAKRDDEAAGIEHTQRRLLLAAASCAQRQGS